MTPRTQVRREPRETIVPLRPRDAASIRQAQEESDMARCPLCRRVLVARQGRHGPQFSCACPQRRREPYGSPKECHHGEGEAPAEP